MRTFISYRRYDSTAIAERMADRLFAYFGETAVFKDVNSINVGTDFCEVLNQALDACDCLLAIIGPHWLGEDPQHHVRRIDDPKDFVRLEIATALSRKIAIIPVLVEGASMPTQSQLPPDLVGLPSVQALRIRHDPDFHKDVDYLIRTLIERHTINEIIFEFDKRATPNPFNPTLEDPLRDIFTEQHECDPRNPIALVRRGQQAFTTARIGEGGYAQALADFRAALGIDSKFADPHFGIGTVYYDLGIADLVLRGRYRVHLKGKVRANKSTGQLEMLAPVVELFLDQQASGIFALALEELQTGMALKQNTTPNENNVMAYEYMPSDVNNKILSLRTLLDYQPLRELDQSLIMSLQMLLIRLRPDEAGDLLEYGDSG